MNLLKPQRPPQIDLEAHWFDLYNHTPKDGVIPSSVGDTSRLPQAGRAYDFNLVDSHVSFNEITQDSKLEVELYFNTPSAKGMVLGDNTTAINSYVRILSSTQIRVKGINPTTADFTFDNIPLNQWNKLYIKIQNNQVTCFLNDVRAVQEVEGISGLFYVDQLARYYNGQQGSTFEYEGKLKDVKIWNGDNLDLVLWYKCEDTGLIAFDSSGNGNHGTKVNTDVLGANTFSYTGSDVPNSYQNEVGYSDGDGSDNNGLYIPRDESNPTLDVLGNPLQYKGKVSYPAKLVESNCLSFDGVDDYVIIDDSTFTVGQINEAEFNFEAIFNNVTSTQRILGISIFNGGQAGIGIFSGSLQFRFTVDIGTIVLQYPVQINTLYKVKGLKKNVNGNSVFELYVNNELVDSTITVESNPVTNFSGGLNISDPQFTLRGVIWNVKTFTTAIKGQSHLPCAEGNGTTVYDISGNDNHGTLVNGVSWVQENDVYHYNYENGYSLYQHNTDTVANPDIRVPLGINPTITDYTKIKDVQPSLRNHNGAETKVDFNPYNAPALSDTVISSVTEDVPYQSLSKGGETLYYNKNGADVRALNYLKIISGLDTDARNIFDRLPNPLLNKEIISINTWTKSSKNSSNFSKYDYFYGHFLSDRDNALTDWITGKAATAVNSPIHTANQGFSFNGSNQYIDSNIDLSTDSTNYQGINASGNAFCYQNNDNTRIATLFGVRSIDNDIRFTIFQLNQNTISTQINSRFGTQDINVINGIEDMTLYQVNRISINQVQVLIDNQIISTFLESRTAIPNTNTVLIGAFNAAGNPTSFFNGTISYFFNGSGSFNQTSLNNELSQLANDLIQ